MKRLETYLSEYAESHQNPVNIKLHNLCVPAIMWSLLGFAYTFGLTEGLTLAHAITFAALVYYAFFENVRVVLAMTAMTLVMFATFPWIPQLRWVSLFVFVLAWIGQFYGHKVEGKKPSFFQDLLFLLIGPVWVLSKLFPALIGRPPTPGS
ncbi:MAG: DUF962 domain-containing protein [Bdellovibrionaceae bacterium]|nr:DUF962 domain-containing protein [Pseudobdellovibrionaceae bacterium]